jgi:hypothetical protein
LLGLPFPAIADRGTSLLLESLESGIPLLPLTASGPRASLPHPLREAQGAGEAASLMRCATLAAAVVGAGLVGCTTVGPPPISLRDAKSYTFQDGWGAQEFPATPADVQQAALDSLRDLEMTGIHREQAGADVMLDARSHDGRHTRVAVRRSAGGAVVAARVGRAGDDVLSRTLMNRVGVRLGTRPAEPLPEDLPTEPATAGSGRFAREAVPDAVMLPDQTGSFYRDSPAP